MIKTVIYFDYGGFYDKTENGYRWDSKDALYYAITMKTLSLEDLTYSVLEERIRNKVGIDRGKKIKMSYIPLSVQATKQSYILDDDDVESYLGSTCDAQRSILHVEIEDLVDENLRGELGSYKGEMITNVSNHNTIVVGVDDQLDVVGVGFGEIVGNEDLVVMNADVGVDECGVNEWIKFPSDPYDGEGSQFVDEWEDGMSLELGQEFGCKQQVQDIVFMASHKRCYDFDVLNSDSWRYVVRCRQRSCKWYLRVSRPRGSEGSWLVKVYRKMHSCYRVSASTSKSKRRGSSDLVAAVLQSDYPGQLNTPSAKSLIGVVQGKVGVKVSYRTALRGKHKAAWAVRGNPEESYKRLPSYLFFLEKTNIGTVTRLVLDEENRFKYLFIALGACITWFKAMRKVLSVDATFLKTIYGGVLIFATAQDPNHHHYPIAFAVVDGEKDASWKLFFTMLKIVVPDDPKLVFLSDRNPSLIKAVMEVYPRACHGYCIFHLSQNVRTKVGNIHKENVAKRFRELAQIYTVAQFEVEYAEFRSRYPKAVEYLDISVDVAKWARCYFPGVRYNIGTTNSAESLNSVFREARKYSLLVMIDTIIEKMAEWFNKHRNDSADVNSRQLVPFVENELHSRCEDATHLMVHELNLFQREYVVVGRDGKSYLVDLVNKSCACRRFDMDKYPCVHAIAALLTYMRNPTRIVDIHLYELCSKYYLVEQWLLVYSQTLYHVPDISQCIGIPYDITSMNILPPPYVKKIGRLQETRYPSVGESRRKSSNKTVPNLDLEHCFNINNQREI